MISERNELNQKVTDRAQIFMRIAKSAVDKINPSGILIPGFITGYHGFTTSVYDQVVRTFPANPHYNPDAPHTPENIALGTGFSWTEVQTHVVDIHCTKNTGDYDDDDEPELFCLNHVPLELFETGTIEQIEAYTIAKYTEAAGRQSRVEFVTKLDPVLKFSPEELRIIADEVESHASSGGPWTNYSEIVNNLQEKLCTK